MEQTVTISDGHPLLRQGLLGIVSTMSISSVSECATGDKTWRDILRHRPDVAIVSSDIQKIRIRDLAERIKERKLSSRLLVLVKHQDIRYARSLLEYGAHGIVSFDAPTSEIAEAIEALLSKKLFVSDSFRFSSINAELPKDESSDIDCVRLSEREKDVLMLVARGSSNKEIASSLRISIRTVESHRYHLRLKTGARKSSDLVLFAARIGLIDLYGSVAC